MPQNHHVFPDLVFVVLSTLAWLYLGHRAAQAKAFQAKWRRTILGAVVVFLLAALALGYLFVFIRVARLFGPDLVTWIQAFSLIEGLWALGTAVPLALARSIPYRPQRREVLRAAGAVIMGAPAAVAAFGILTRNNFRVSQADVRIAGLPKDLDGLRMIQVSDVHLSAFLSRRELARVIDMANETKADIALVTGDLITRRGDPIDASIAEIARLRAPAGVFGCMGNHERYAGIESYVAEESARRGIRFLRHENTGLRFGDSWLNLAGVDYQRMGAPYLRGARSLIVPGHFNVLLSHNPDVFPVAAGQGWDFTISGHTHGGQIDVEILDHDVSVARYYTPFVRGLYRSGNAAVYVTTGVGTVGVPIRLGAPPEISLIRLCSI